LNRLPNVKKFLKGGEAEQYEGIKVEWIRGKKPVLTIYEDGVQREEVQLENYDDVDRLHALFAEKGFQKKEGGEAVTTKVAEAPQKAALRQPAGISNLKKVEEASKLGSVSRLGKAKVVSKFTTPQAEPISKTAGTEEMLESSPMHAFGALTGIAIGAFAFMTITKSRKKNGRATR